MYFKPICHVMTKKDRVQNNKQRVNISDLLLEDFQSRAYLEKIEFPCVCNANVAVTERRFHGHVP